MEISKGKFVITGGASLIGSHVVEQLLRRGAWLEAGRGRADATQSKPGRLIRSQSNV